MFDLLEEIDARLTTLVIGWPAAEPLIRGIQKHVKYGLNNPEKVDAHSLLQHTRGMMFAAMVNVPEFEDLLRPLAEKIDKELGE